MMKDDFDQEMAAMSQHRSRMTYRLADVLTAIEQLYEISPTELLGPHRARRFTQHRRRVWYLGRKDLQMTITQLGRITNRDHSTVLHGLSTFDSDEEQIELDRLRFAASKIARERDVVCV